MAAVATGRALDPARLKVAWRAAGFLSLHSDGPATCLDSARLLDLPRIALSLPLTTTREGCTQDQPASEEERITLASGRNQGPTPGHYTSPQTWLHYALRLPSFKLETKIQENLRICIRSPTGEGRPKPKY